MGRIDLAGLLFLLIVFFALGLLIGINVRRMAVRQLLTERDELWERLRGLQYRNQSLQEAIWGRSKPKEEASS